jgi:hypothetical protein
VGEKENKIQRVFGVFWEIERKKERKREIQTHIYIYIEREIKECLSMYV